MEELQASLFQESMKMSFQKLTINDLSQRKRYLSQECGYGGAFIIKLQWRSHRLFLGEKLHQTL